MAQACERLRRGGPAAVARRRLRPHAASGNLRPQFHLATGYRGRRRVSLDFDIAGDAGIPQQPAGDPVPKGIEVRYRLDEPASRAFPVLRRHARRRRHRLHRDAADFRRRHRSTHRAGPPSSRVASPTSSSTRCDRWCRPLARLVEIIGLRRIATTLLDTYVGNRAGERILGGQIRRGHTETMRAAIWLSDLRGFTALSDRLPPETVVEILNRYFDCQVPAIRKHGGEVLKFMGDGLLAVFPIAEDDGDLARRLRPRAGGGARGPRRRRGDGAFARRRAIERFRFGLALHVGGPVRQYRRRQPARFHLHRPGGQSRRAAGEDRRPPRTAPSWRRWRLPASAAASWAELGEFPIAGFAKADGSMAWRTRRQRADAAA